MNVLSGVVNVLLGAVNMLLGAVNVLFQPLLIPAAAALLGGMQNLTAGRALASFGGTWLPLLQRRVPPPPPAPLGNEPSVPVLRLSGNASYRFACAGALVTSNAFDNCPDTQYEWEAVPSATHDHTLAVAPFAIDRDPVGCARYARYLRATGYIPADARNFLRGWPNANLSRGEVEFPAGNATTPVTSVSHGEAKAFCAWAGGRLPSSTEQRKKSMPRSMVAKAPLRPSRLPPHPLCPPSAVGGRTGW